jgi:hypothetical protein
MAKRRKDVAANVTGFATNPVDAAMYTDSETEETDALFSALSDMRKGSRAAVVPVSSAGELAYNGWTLTPTGLVAPEQVNERDYEEIGRVLLRLDSSMQWLIGDWINHGDNFQWGETYARVAAEFGYSENTVMQYAYVARKVEISIRYRDLSFGHHQLVVGMARPEQEQWLQKAADEGLSIAKLRAAIKQSQLPPPPEPTDDEYDLNGLSVGDRVVDDRGDTGHIRAFSNATAHVIDEVTRNENLIPCYRLRPAPPHIQHRVVAAGNAPQPGDYVRTRAGHVGTVESVTGRTVNVRAGSYTTQHNAASLTPLETVDESDTYNAPAPPEPPPAPDDNRAGKQWRAATDAWHDVRSSDLTYRDKSTMPSQFKERTRQKIRDLIAHLQYIDSQFD